MNMQHIYTPDDKMSDLILENYSLLLVMNRFGLSLGIGEKTIREVCDQSHVDCKTFLAVVNFMINDSYLPSEAFDDFSIESLTAYLQNAHIYFFEYRFPSVRQKLISAIDSSESKLYGLLLKYYDEYVDELKKHTDYEENTLFRHVYSLLKGDKSLHQPMGTMHRWHDDIELKVKELKNIIIKYYPAKDNGTALNLALYDFFACEEEFDAHCRIEDYLFAPAIEKLEKKARKPRK
jgi:regulator of cell morphogenesis and NO signaling